MLIPRHLMQDFSRITAGLELRADGIWYAKTRPAVDYPDEGNAFCYQVEDASFWFHHRNAAITQLVARFPPNGWIADIGAGNGFVAAALNRAGFPTVAIEPGPTGVRNARARGVESVICSTLDAAGFQPGSIPAAGLFDVLEHIGEADEFLAALRRLLADNGRLYLTVPAYNALWSTEDELVGHHRRYTLRTLTRALAHAGYRVEFGTYLFSPLPAAILLFKTLPSRVGFRRTLDPTQLAGELRTHDNVVTRAVSRVLRLELKRLKSGRRIPLGSSCLVVARTT